MVAQIPHLGHESCLSPGQLLNVSAGITRVKPDVWPWSSVRRHRAREAGIEGVLQAVQEELALGSHRNGHDHGVAREQLHAQNQDQNEAQGEAEQAQQEPLQAGVGLHDAGEGSSNGQAKQGSEGDEAAANDAQHEGPREGHGALGSTQGGQLPPTPGAQRHNVTRQA